ncbi:MAG TPA: protein kinase, partial [Vicinamibacteria bacterium]|nr:protein kinase [Vicinamibacteria bacterium]
VMEYLKGQGLDVWIKNPHFLNEQLVVLDDLCHALSYAHENGVLHRDVKPSNVQILPNGHAKLMDFGIARAAAGKLTATGSVMGTPEYMAPEILNDAAYSPRSDLYACAVLLYEMFTGANPFAAKTVAAALTNVLTLNPPDIRVLHPDFPRRLAETLMACLHKEPALRPDGFGALLAASREAAGGPPMAAIPETRAIPVSPAPPVGRGRAGSELVAPPGRGPRWAWFGGAGAIVVLGLLWALNRGGTPPPPAEPVAASPNPRSVAVAATPAPLEAPSAAPTPGTRATPIPKPSRSPREQPDRETTTTPRAEPTPTPTAVANAAPSIAPSFSTPTPQPRPSAPVEPALVATPLAAAPGRPAVATPVVSGISPRTVRRGSSVDLEIKGEGLRRDLKAQVMQGRRPAAGIQVLRQEFVSGNLIRIRILIEAETPLLTYSIVFQDASGVLTQGVQIEVVL